MPTGNALCPVPNTPVTTETPTLTLPTATPDVYQNLKSTFLPSGNYAMLFLDDWIDEYNLANQSYNEYYNAFLKGLTILILKSPALWIRKRKP
ncbi:MAG: hypothetical protein IPJ47_16450 [Anaerolineales bacterium]|nr:hypothetical protein [Anaerolineales bacterium]